MPTAGSLASVQAHTPVANQPTTVATTVGTTIVPAIGGPVIHTHPTPAGQSAVLQMGGTTVSSGMILSPALQPIPARLVRRICAGEFVEMRDLLSDNITLIDQLEAVHGPLLTAATPGALRPRVREVPSLISWVFCFLAYTAVRTTDLTTRDMLAYCRLVVREGLRHGGQGWQDYDRVSPGMDRHCHTLCEFVYPDYKLPSPGSACYRWDVLHMRRTTTAAQWMGAAKQERDHARGDSSATHL